MKSSDKKKQTVGAQLSAPLHTFRLEDYLASRKAMVDEALDKSLGERSPGHPKLIKAMRYSLFAGGKRLRPILAIAAAEAVGASAEEVLTPAIALEYIHTYSLIHDDLPAMDNAEMRRGIPTLHKAFDEATAILAGDALLTEAFNILARWGVENAREALVSNLVFELASASGAEGMVSGQVYDLETPGPADIAALDALHRLKTGALIKASVRIGALCAGATKKQLDTLSKYAGLVGLAFQIADDLLDSADMTGKDKDLDAQRGKKTYPILIGRDESARRAGELIEAAKSELKIFGATAEPLLSIADFVIERQS